MNYKKCLIAGYFIIFSFVMNLKSQVNSVDTLNQLDSKGQKQGYWKKTDKKGRPVYEGYFKNNKPIGEFKRYHANSDKLKVIMQFIEGKNEVYTKMFFISGKILGEGNYVNKVKEGKWKYYSVQGYLSLEESYLNGKKNGFSKSYYNNGEYADVTQWKNGVKDGKWRQYFKNGREKLSSSHKNGKRIGDFIMFYDTGEMELKGFYVGDKLHGDCIFYYRNGKIKKKIEYEYGKALNEDELEKEQTEMLEKIEKMRGKIEEPGTSIYKY